MVSTLRFFATVADLQPILAGCEATQKFKYVYQEDSYSPELTTCHHCSDLPRFMEIGEGKFFRHLYLLPLEYYPSPHKYQISS